MKTKLMISAVFGALAVGLGAFGAHALEPLLEANDYLDTYKTGNQYHFYHSLALLLLAIFSSSVRTKWISAAFWLFSGGIILFSGSLYILSISGVRVWGAITPVGGVAFIAGWLCLIPAALKINKDR